MEAKVHIVSKLDSSKHTTVSANSSQLPPLEPGNVRVKPRLVSLTNNNITYASLGTLASWWDAFPVPTFLPSPHDDSSKYGIVPVWGYAEVVSSRIENVTESTIIYGFWPSSTLPVDLQLVPTEPTGHYVDTTPHRQTMWSHYHRYTIAPENFDLSSPTLAAQTVFLPLFGCAHALNAYVLGTPSAHPSPRTNPHEPWDHADLSSAVIISISASGKTARAFNDAVLNTRAPGTGPQALLAITSDPSALTFPVAQNSPIETRILSYSQTAQVSSHLPASTTKVILIDFGGRGDSLTTLLSHLPPNLETVIIGVGTEPSPSASMEERLARMAKVPQRRQMNTSEVQEVLVETLGAEKYFRSVQEAWEGFCERGGCEGVEIEIGEGVQALEVGWKRLCRGEAGKLGGLAFVL